MGILDEVGNCIGFACAGGSQEYLMRGIVKYSLSEGGDGVWLVAGGMELGLKG